MNSNSSSVGSLVKPMVGNVPAAPAAGTRNGAAIDRLGYDSCVLFQQAGASSGTPTTIALDAKLQDSADGSSGWADISGAAITQLTTASSSGKVAVSLSGSKRYIRVVEVLAFTGGTSPTLGVSSSVVLGGPDSLPAA
jgi:hypothetical protein